MVGERIAHRYEVKELLASGGMGVVLRVLDRPSGQHLVLKRIGEHLTSDPRMLAAFEQEYRVLASLDHPRIIRVYEYGVDARGPYYTMEFLPGADFSDAPLPWRQACFYLRDIAASLSLLHARKFLHRDLHPKNIKRTADGHCKLLDFGALTAFGYSQLVMGFPPVIPPEAVRGRMLDARADLYALGALAYCMLTGVHAYRARRVQDLPALWQAELRPPSSFVTMPEALNELVLSLLSTNPLARPASAAEVIAHLNAVADLPVEDARERKQLALSFLHAPRFVGRERELAEMTARIDNLGEGRGGALRIESPPGNGRSRLLEELGLRAQIAGVTVLRVDAGAHTNEHGTSRELAARLLEALPDLARACGRRAGAALALLGSRVRAALGQPSGPPADADPSEPPSEESSSDLASAFTDWFVAVSREQTLMIQVDNVEDADDASLALLLGLTQRARGHPLLLVLADRSRPAGDAPIGLQTIRGQCHTIALPALSQAETLDLLRSVFGDAPNVERFADWIHDQTAGSPWHLLEISRQLLGRDVVRYCDGSWALPAVRPAIGLPAALEDALSLRIDALSPAARRLAQTISLQRGQLTPALCSALIEGNDQARALELLEELARREVLSREATGYRFNSSVLRDVLFASMTERERAENHRQLGDTFAQLAGPLDHALRIEAGLHLIRGGDQTRGAEWIAAAMCDSVVVRRLQANLYRVGVAAEAALKVFNRERRSAYERMPLLSVLAQAALYEDYAWGEEYGDEALDVLEDISGMRLAGRCRRHCGGLMALWLGMSFAVLRFYMVPKRERPYSFRDLMTQLFASVSALTARAAVALDAPRAERLSSVLAPFSVLSERSAARGIHQLCVAMQQIGRDRPSEAYREFDTLARRFGDRGYYRGLSEDVRALCSNGCHFARGAFAIFRFDGRAALESAERLTASGLKLYAMIASQLRFLYHENRGEIEQAALHRGQVELHAAAAGSAWQVELWEGPALLPLCLTLGDVVTHARIVQRLEELSSSVPSLRVYARIGDAGLSIVRGESLARAARQIQRELAWHAPRSFMGWSMALACAASALNRLGDHAQAEQCCAQALARLSDADREYVNLFLELELQMALAEAGLGQVPQAFARVDALLARFAGEPHLHPLSLGLLHETRARIAFRAGHSAAYRESLAQVERYFRPIGTPALIAKCERLAALGRSGRESVPRRASSAPPVAEGFVTVPDRKQSLSRER